jgi:hypothetical protein
MVREAVVGSPADEADRVVADVEEADARQEAHREGDGGRYEERAMTNRMGRVICDITISADGYSAGLNQTEERPFGDDGGDGWGDKLHAWLAETPRRTGPRSTR